MSTENQSSWAPWQKLLQQQYTQPTQQFFQQDMGQQPFQPQGTDWAAISRLLAQTRMPKTVAQFDISGQQIDPTAERNPWKNGYFNKLGTDANPFSWDMPTTPVGRQAAINQANMPQRAMDPGLPSVPFGTYDNNGVYHGNTTTSGRSFFGPFAPKTPVYFDPNAHAKPSTDQFTQQQIAQHASAFPLWSMANFFGA